MGVEQVPPPTPPPSHTVFKNDLREIPNIVKLRFFVFIVLMERVLAAEMTRC